MQIALTSSNAAYFAHRTRRKGNMGENGSGNLRKNKVKCSRKGNAVTCKSD